MTVVICFMPQEVHLVLVSNDPQRAYPAFTLAMGAVAMGAKAKVYCTMGALDLIKKGGADKVQIPGMPSLGKFLRDAVDAGVEVCACGPSAEMLAQMGISDSTIEPGVTIEDVVGFLKNALPAAKEGGVISFV